VSFLGRLFSSDLRTAQRAEARGQIELAAEHYGLAGDRAGAVRMHLARARRAADRPGELAALHDALHWAGVDADLRRAPAAELGRALLAAATAEGVGTEKDRARVREAAALLVEGGDHEQAGKALATLGDHAGAASAYSAGGHIDALESSLALADDAGERQREIERAYADYQAHLQIGQRDDARAALARAIGRDALCEVPLRSAGISRRHAEIIVGGSARFALRDAGSRNGTRLGGMMLAGTLPLAGAGELALGDDVELDFEARPDDAALVLSVRGGLDRGTKVVLVPPGARAALPLAAPGFDVVFVDGRPWLGRDSAFSLGTQRVAEGRVQLIRGDRISAGDVTLDVE
jgi:tetratricopeptide (TPR) repeat protein